MNDKTNNNETVNQPISNSENTPMPGMPGFHKIRDWFPTVLMKLLPNPVDFYSHVNLSYSPKRKRALSELSESAKQNISYQLTSDVILSELLLKIKQCGIDEDLSVEELHLIFTLGVLAYNDGTGKKIKGLKTVIKLNNPGLALGTTGLYKLDETDLIKIEEIREEVS